MSVTTHTTTSIHKTLYDGTKTYWRTRETVDVRIIEHMDKVLEVIAFDVEKHEEADRLYLDAEKLYKKLETSELLEQVEEKRAEYARMRKRVPLEEITRGLVRQVATQYILTRLITTETRLPRPILQPVGPGETPTVLEEDACMSENGDNGSSNESPRGTMVAETNAAVSLTVTTDGESADTSSITRSSEDQDEVEDSSPRNNSRSKPITPVVLLAEPRFAVDLSILTGDKAITYGPKGSAQTQRLDMLLSERPSNIEHITIVRARKKATKTEFHAALRSLKQDSAKLNAACSDAQRKAGLAVSSVDGFQSMIRKYDPAVMSLAQWRWIWACRRVCLQNYVKAVTKRLEELDRKNEGEDDLVEGALSGESANAVKVRRRKNNDGNASKLPSLSSKSGRHSLGNLRRLTRGSREPRPLDEFSSALSASILDHSNQNSKYGLVTYTGMSKSERKTKSSPYASASLDRLPSV